VTLSVGILAADLLRLGEQLDCLGEAGVEVLHVDVMDGVFCPQMTVGPPLVAVLPRRFVADVHLMIDEPLGKVEAFVEAGARILTFHIESTRHPHRVLQSLDGRGLIRGVALNPGTPVASVAPLLDDLELLLVLGINPGWQGQTFIPATAGRLAEARELIGDREIVLGVDGGVTRDNVEQVAALCPDVIVAGSAIFSGGDVGENARAMLAATAGLRGFSRPATPAP
jgi:ribulose-phosphate 3-epimerase